MLRAFKRLRLVLYYLKKESLLLSRSLAFGEAVKDQGPKGVRTSRRQEAEVDCLQYTVKSDIRDDRIEGSWNRRRSQSLPVWRDQRVCRCDSHNPLSREGKKG